VFLDAISSHRAGRLSCVEAEELLGFIERHFRRMRDAFEARGEDALIDRRRGRVRARAADKVEDAWVAAMSRTRYFVVRGKLFYDQIVGMPRASGSSPSMKRRRGAADERQVALVGAVSPADVCCFALVLLARNLDLLNWPRRPWAWSMGHGHRSGPLGSRLPCLPARLRRP